MPQNNHIVLAGIETQEWLDSLEYVHKASGAERVIELLDQLQ